MESESSLSIIFSLMLNCTNVCISCLYSLSFSLFQLSYVFQWRWDVENDASVWTQCAVVTIEAEKSSLRGNFNGLSS